MSISFNPEDRVPSENQNLSDFTSLSEKLKSYNTKYKGTYPQLTKTQLVGLCSKHGVPLYSFQATVNVRSRIYVSKKFEVYDLIVKEFKITSILEEDSA